MFVSVKNNLLLTVSLVAGGLLGNAMVLPSVFASPIWPPAGIGLAAVLLGGWRLWPGLLLGYVMSQVLVHQAVSPHYSMQLFSLSLMIAVGSFLKTWLAYGLSARWLGAGVPTLDTPRSILLFFGAATPLSSVISASIGTGSLWLWQMIAGSDTAGVWLTWWVGDSLGVLIITPLLFCLLGRPLAFWQRRRLRVAAPLAAALLALIGIFAVVFHSEQIRVQQVFNTHSATIQQLVERDADKIIDMTLDLRDWFAATQQVDSATFNAFANTLLQRDHELNGLAWVPRVPQAGLPRFEQWVQRQGQPNFRVQQRNAAGDAEAVTARADYFPVLYSAHQHSAGMAVGLDSGVDAAKRQAYDRATASGKATVAVLPGSGDGEAVSTSVWLVVPLFADGNNLMGFVVGEVLPATLANMQLHHRDNQGLALYLQDVTDASQPQPLFQQQLPASTHLGVQYQLQPWQQAFSFADRQWQLTISADNTFINRHGSLLPWLTAVGGLLFTGLLTLFLLTISGKTAQVEALADARQQALDKSTAELEAADKVAQESSRLFQTLLSSQQDFISLLDRNGELLEMNHAGLAIIEADTVQQAAANSLLHLILPPYRKRFKALLRQVYRGQSVSLEYEMQGLKGGRRWLETQAVPLRDNAGQVMSVLNITRDISARKAAEDRLALAASVFSEAREGILITDANGLIIDVNPMFTEITGYSREEVIGQNPRMLQSGKHTELFYTAMWDALHATRHWQGEIWNRRKNGEMYAELLTLSAITTEQGEIVNFIGLFSDITDSKQQQHDLEMLAHYDGLTRLPNRTLFADRIKQAMAHSDRFGTLLAVCFLDLDGFKPINDSHGHEMGDAVLLEVANRITNSLREEDTVSRHGGDEFALLLGDLRSQAECDIALERIHAVIAEPIVLPNGASVNVYGSSGITFYPLDRSNADTLVRHADQAMYQSKLAGKNRHSYFDLSKDQQIIDQHDKRREIASAFAAGQLCLFYQPKVNIKTGSVVGVEALIRWRHADLGLLSPGMFLPIISNTELEITIGNWVIEQAWQQLVLWHQQGLHLEVSVNISSFHLLWPGFVGHVQQVLENNSAVSSRYLHLEILESTALHDLSAVNRVVKTCQDELGLSIALDDFGTGYSSLSHLRHLSADIVKIDQTFVRDMLDDPDDYAIIESVIGLSMAFHREVIAEGVESKEQGIVLLLLGCHLVQGYAVARPMEAFAIAEWVKAYEPFAEWQYYAAADLTPIESVQAIRRIDIAQWLHSFKAAVAADAKARQWPVIGQRKTHLGRWIKQVRFSRQFSEDWVSAIEALNRNLHEHAMPIKTAVEGGESSLLNDHMEQLEGVCQRLDGLFNQFHQPVA